MAGGVGGWWGWKVGFGWSIVRAGRLKAGWIVREHQRWG
jgi:hypothetical protein